MSEAISHICIMSFGCQMNKLDTTLVSCALEESGFILTRNTKDANVILINTCSVRQHAEQRVLSNLGHIKHIKKERPDLVVGVIGCMAQRLGSKLLEHEVVDIVCGPMQLSNIADLIKTCLREKHKLLAITEKIRQQDEVYNQTLERFESTYGIEDRDIPGQAFVRVMRGCNNFCTYCVVPFVRGPEVCRAPTAIMEQIKKLADVGVKQVTLLGQRVNAYKYKAGEKTYCLADLLDMASQIHGIEWIKFVTSYPSEQFFDQILDVMAASPKVCNYLHMPAQSGSDRILKAMNRHYTAAQYRNMLDRAKAVVPDIAAAGDFIVGFPQETEQDFQATVQLVKKAKYKNCFIFKYSPRPGTMADKKLTDTAPSSIKQQRNIELLTVQEKISDELSRRFLRKKVTVLVEGLSKKSYINTDKNSSRPQLVGRTAEDWIVVFNGPMSLAGEFAQIEIIQTSPLTLFGELTN
jgi:tRNA-2-methylthio-N6-dimethylallyladenosine synthase